MRQVLEFAGLDQGFGEFLKCLTDHFDLLHIQLGRRRQFAEDLGMMFIAAGRSRAAAAEQPDHLDDLHIRVFRVLVDLAAGFHVLEAPARIERVGLGDGLSCFHLQRPVRVEVISRRQTEEYEREHQQPARPTAAARRILNDRR